MHLKRSWAAAATVALVTTGLSGAAGLAGPGSPAGASPRVNHDYLVLLDRGAAAGPAVRSLRASGADVTAVNRAIGLVSVSSSDPAFRARGAAISGVQGVTVDRTIGHVPARDYDVVEKEHLTAGAAGATGTGHVSPVTGDPFDSLLWGMKMIHADRAHRVDLGSKRVRVGVMDTGVDASHPDLAPNFDWRLSRNFVTDMPEIDGPCEHPSCVDPVGEDNGGHGTHVAGIMAAALNGMGVSGVAPRVDLVEVRSGQDSGYFFLEPTVDALTYAARAGIDVVNMSFYVDPWLYNCAGGAPEDSPAEAEQQDLIREAMHRALDFAHDRGVTLVAALGNNHEDVANPRIDTSSPDFGAPPHDRTIDNRTCLDLPVEGPHVIGVSALGPSGVKADYSNYTTKPRSGELEVSAPGGYYRDGLGTADFQTVGNLILSTYPLNALQAEGLVDEHGVITPDGEAAGVMKDCTDHPAPRATECGYYAYLQGTSMAAPHAAGVAALAVSAYGHRIDGDHGHGHGGFGLDPNQVTRILERTATDHACPPGGVQSYEDVGRSAEWTATCVGGRSLNGFYGHGIVNAFAVVRGGSHPES